MNTTHVIAPFVEAFFQQHLAAQRGLSANTVLNYRDCLKLLLRFAVERAGKPADKLTIEDFDEKMVTAFLDNLEVTHGNCRRTRNSRLAALHSFFRYVCYREPSVIWRCQQICAIPVKRRVHKTIEYLDDKEMRALLHGVDHSERNSHRDCALLLFLYNTGARAQEAIDVEINDLRFEIPPQVKITGKGGKERVLPLWPETVAALKNYFNYRGPSTAEVPKVFLNANGKPITRFGVRYITRRYGAKAGKECHSLNFKKVNPHTVRHATAMHLLQSGNDITVVKDWMGHAYLNTTHGYVEIDMKMKCKALEACPPPKAKKTGKGRPEWLKPGILEWLDRLSKTA